MQAKPFPPEKEICYIKPSMLSFLDTTTLDSYKDFKLTYLNRQDDVLQLLKKKSEVTLLDIFFTGIVEDKMTLKVLLSTAFKNSYTLSRPITGFLDEMVIELKYSISKREWLSDKVVSRMAH